MTREEAIFCEKSYIGETNCTDCNYYGTETCLSRESHRMAIKALEQETVSKESYDHEYFLRKELEMKIARLEHDKNEVLDKIRAEIKAKIEQEEFARSVFRHEEKDTARAEQCTGSIMAYNNVIRLIDKYKE